MGPEFRSLTGLDIKRVGMAVITAPSTLKGVICL